MCVFNVRKLALISILDPASTKMHLSNQLSHKKWYLFHFMYPTVPWSTASVHRYRACAVSETPPTPRSALSLSTRASTSPARSGSWRPTRPAPRQVRPSQQHPLRLPREERTLLHITVTGVLMCVCFVLCDCLLPTLLSSFCDYVPGISSLASSMNRGRLLQGYIIQYNTIQYNTMQYNTTVIRWNSPVQFRYVADENECVL